MNVEEYNKKHSSDYALAGLGKRTLAFFLDLLIVVVVAWVLNANVTSTFMFNALGANEITKELRTFAVDSSLVEPIYDNNNDEMTGITYYRFEPTPQKKTQVNSDGTTTEIVTQEKYGYQLYLEKVFYFYTDFLMNDDRCNDVRVTTTVGNTTTTTVLEGEEAYFNYFYASIMGLPSLSEEDKTRTYDLTTEEGDDEKILQGKNAYFRYALKDETGTPGDFTIDFRAMPVLISSYQNSLDQGLYGNAAANTLNGYFYDYNNTDPKGIYYSAVSYLIGQDGSGDQTYYSVRSANINYYSWLCLIPAYLPIAFIVFFLIPVISPRGQTVGKMLTGILLVDNEGLLLNWKFRLLHYFIIMGMSLFILLPSLGVGIMLYLLVALIDYIIIVMSKRKTGLEDMVAKSLVIDSKNSRYFKTAEDKENYFMRHPEMAPVIVPLDMEENERIKRENAILDLSTLNKHREEARNMTSFDEFERMKDEEEKKRTEELRSKSTPKEKVSLRKDELSVEEKETIENKIEEAKTKAPEEDNFTDDTQTLAKLIEEKVDDSDDSGFTDEKK